MPEVSSRGSFRAKVAADHRNGICEKCDIPMEKNIIVLKGKDKIIMRCKKCGGTTGQLIARSVVIEAPSPPTCFRFSCLWIFYFKVVFSWLLSIYHKKRVEYATRKRHKRIPMKYRTGEDSPKTIKQAILAIIKLSLRR